MANEFTFAEDSAERPVTMFGPDFPFPFDDWITHPAGLGSIPEERLGEEVAIVGAGMSGMVAAYELMKLGLRPVVYEASHMGGRLRSQQFEGAPTGVIAELGGMRFPVSSTSFYHYVDLLGLKSPRTARPLGARVALKLVARSGVHAPENCCLRRSALLPRGIVPLSVTVVDARREARARRLDPTRVTHVGRRGRGSGRYGRPWHRTLWNH